MPADRYPQAGRYLLGAEVAPAKAQAKAISVQAGRWATITLRYLVTPYML